MTQRSSASGRKPDKPAATGKHPYKKASLAPGEALSGHSTPPEEEDAREGKPELETPESSVAPPEDSPRDEEAPLETREEFVEELAEVVESADPPVVFVTSGLSPDEISLIRAQHNL